MSENYDSEWKSIARDLHEDAQSSRHFLTTAIPLGCGYALAAQIWMRSAEPFWLLLSVITLASLIGYLIAFILRGFRKRKKEHLDATSLIRYRWIGVLSRAVDNDALFMSITVGVPLLELMTLSIGDHIAHGVALEWVQAAVCVLYLIYVALFLVIQGHHAVMLMLRAKELELARTNEQMAMMQRDAAIASKTHDGVTGTLSFIAFIAQKHMAEIAVHSGSFECAEDSNDWAAVNKAALDALDDVHTVIRLLGSPLSNDVDSNGIPLTETPASASSTMSNSSPSKLIEHVCSDGDSRLHCLGFQGSSTIKLGDNAVKRLADVSDVSAFADLIEELYTNISKHADKETPYYLTITSEQSDVVIVQSNGVARQTDGIAEHETRRPSGMQQGLSLHRQQIENLGGTMNSSIEDGEWTIYIHIPVTGHDMRTPFPSEGRGYPVPER